MYTRKHWVSACQFHDLTEPEVLNEVSRRVSESEQPLVLLDLDSTLYEVAPRSYQILKEWAQSDESQLYPQVQSLIQKMTLDQMRYSMRETFSHLGLDDSEALASAQQFWMKTFFTNEYLKYDVPYAGASDFARSIHQLGAEIVYLTGRDEPNMGEGTRRNLIRDGFPWEVERTHLLMKPYFEMPDLEYKLSTASFIQQRGKLIASFENEPPNLAALYRIFPDAMHVFVDTVCSDHQASVCHGIYRIAGFSIPV